MEAVTSGTALIKAGMADIILAGGAESMSNSPYSLPGSRWGWRYRSAGSRRPHHRSGIVDRSCCPVRKKDLQRRYAVDMFKGKPYIMA